jgi:hypothetical protein
MTRDQMIRMAGDAEFQAKLANDPELRRIAERSDCKHVDSMESAIALGCGFTVAGREFSPPSAGVLSALELIDSPFVTPGIEIRRADVSKALYIMAERSKAVGPLFMARRFEERLQSVKELCAANQDALLVWMRYSEQADTAWAEFDRKAEEFADSLGAYKFDSVVDDLFDYLRLCGGLELIPRSGSAEKKTD